MSIYGTLVQLLCLRSLRSATFFGISFKPLFKGLTLGDYFFYLVKFTYTCLKNNFQKLKVIFFLNNFYRYIECCFIKAF